MKIHIIQGVAVFAAVCGMGFFTACAGGVHWGTNDAGAAAGVSFMLATFLGGFVATFPRGT